MPTLNISLELSDNETTIFGHLAQIANTTPESLAARMITGGQSVQQEIKNRVNMACNTLVQEGNFPIEAITRSAQMVATTPR